MADPKQEFLEKTKKSLSDFKELMTEFIISTVGKLDSAEGNPSEEMLDELEESHKAKIRELRNLQRKILSESKQVELQVGMVGTGAKLVSDPEINKLLTDIEDILMNPVDYAHSKQISKRQEEVRALEPTENLGSVDIGKVMTKDEIENKMFELHKEQQDAISSSEKDEIQKKLDQLTNLYKNSSAKNRLKK
jgi:hypothetical protein